MHHRIMGFGSAAVARSSVLCAQSAECRIHSESMLGAVTNWSTTEIDRCGSPELLKFAISSLIECASVLSQSIRLPHCPGGRWALTYANERDGPSLHEMN
jgi:hypothetical protein